MPRPAKAADEVAAVRRDLLDVAQQLLEEDGIDGMSFRAIAQRAGCSHTKPYSYFDSKADLIDALRLRSYEWLHELLATAAAMHEAPIDALRGLSEAYLQAGLDRPRLYELLYTDQGAVDETDPPLLAAKHAALGVCRDVIQAAADAGDLELAVDSLTAAHLFWAGAHGLVQLDLGGFLVVGRSVDDLVPVLIATLSHGITRQPDSKEPTP